MTDIDIEIHCKQSPNQTTPPLPFSLFRLRLNLADHAPPLNHRRPCIEISPRSSCDLQAVPSHLIFSSSAKACLTSSTEYLSQLFLGAPDLRRSLEPAKQEKKHQHHSSAASRRARADPRANHRKVASARCRDSLTANMMCTPPHTSLVIDVGFFSNNVPSHPLLLQITRPPSAASPHAHRPNDRQRQVNQPIHPLMVPSPPADAPG